MTSYRQCILCVGVALVVLSYGGLLLANNQISPGNLMSFFIATQTIQRFVTYFYIHAVSSESTSTCISTYITTSAVTVSCNYKWSHLTLRAIRGRHQAVLQRFCVAAGSCDEVSITESLQGCRHCLTCVMSLYAML